MKLWLVSTFLDMNVGAMNICVHIFVWINVFNYFECIPKSGIAKLYDEFMFNFYMTCVCVGSHLFFNFSIEHLHFKIEHYIYPSIKETP